MSDLRTHNRSSRIAALHIRRPALGRGSEVLFCRNGDGLRSVVLPLLFVLSTFVSGLSASVAHAQSNTAPTNTDGQGWHKEQCLGGLTYGAPLKLAASWAGGWRKELESGQDVCAFVSPKIGLGGARLGVGLARTTGTFGGGIAASAAIIRTFGSPSYADRQSTYGGASLHVFPLLGIGLELGWYKRLGGATGRGRESIIAWSAGIGF